MTCEQVRDLISEYVFDTLDQQHREEIARHVRGCAGCRAEVTALERGLVAVTMAGPSMAPPDALQDRVLGAVLAEWGDGSDRVTSRPVRDDDARGNTRTPGPLVRRGGARAGWAVASVVGTVLILVIGVGGVALQNAQEKAVVADDVRAKAERYDNFLGVLGGQRVRGGAMVAAPDAPLEGSVIVYDSTVGQNWVLGLVRAPEMQGRATLVLEGPAGRLRLHPMELGSGPSDSTWLVTDRDLRGFDRFVVLDGTGNPVATGTLT